MSAPTMVPPSGRGRPMGLRLRARFIVVFALVGAIALAAVLSLHAQLRAHDAAVAASLRAMAAPTGSASTDAANALRTATTAIDLADRQFRRDLAMSMFALVLSLAGLAWWAWHGLLQPVLAIARVARQIEAGERVAALAMAQHEDEIGDIASAFATLDDAIGALRERMHHDADLAPRPGAAPTSVAREALAPVAAVVSAPIAVPAPAPVAPAPPPEPTAEQVERLRRLEDDLQHAWRRGELHVLYQPIHSLSDGRMRGAEALLRWEHPLEGAVSPVEFVPLAERSELILELGRQVLVQACADASLWPGDGNAETSPFISVNVAPAQLRDQKMFEYVVEALRKSGLAATRLHLEVPVQALRDDDPVVDAMIEQLRGLGLQIWVDATGVDATDQHKWMRPSVSGVKVGQGRIRGRQDNTAEASSADAIVASARALRIVAVVVGVEQLAELNVLKEQGADLAQGYVLCKPVDTTEIGRRLLA